MAFFSLFRLSFIFTFTVFAEIIAQGAYFFEHKIGRGGTYYFGKSFFSPFEK